MEKQSELLIRSALHDLANVLAGVRGILELADPSRPLSPRDRARLDAVVEEGLATLARTRHLAMDTLPDEVEQEGQDWRGQLADELQPLGTLFRCAFTVALGAGTGPDRWPGTRLRSYVRAAVRQALPYCRGGAMTILCEPGPEAWRLRLTPVDLLPEGLAVQEIEGSGDIGARWAQHLGRAQRIDLAWRDGELQVRMPRSPGIGRSGP